MIHRYWTGQGHGRPWTGMLARGFGMQVVDWDDTTVPADILAFADARADLVIDKDRLRHRSNIVRLLLLQRHGGVYIDHDVILLRPLNVLDPEPWAAAHGSLCSCVLSFPKDHPWLAQAIERLPETGEGLTSREASGEHFLARQWPRITRRALPFDTRGQRVPNSALWAVHLFDGGRS